MPARPAACCRALHLLGLLAGLCRARLPLLIAHRGAPCALPEETMPGYRLAMQSQVDFLETDVVGWFPLAG